MPIHARLRASAKQVRDEGCNSLDHEEAMELMRFAAGFILDPARGSAVTHTKVAQKRLSQLATTITRADWGMAGSNPFQAMSENLGEACRLLNGDFRELVPKPPKK